MNTPPCSKREKVLYAASAVLCLAGCALEIAGAYWSGLLTFCLAFGLTWETAAANGRLTRRNTPNN